MLVTLTRDAQTLVLTTLKAGTVGTVITTARGSIVFRPRYGDDMALLDSRDDYIPVIEPVRRRPSAVPPLAVGDIVSPRASAFLVSPIEAVGGRPRRRRLGWALVAVLAGAAVALALF